MDNMLDKDGELDIKKIDQLAREYWQDDLGKFFPKQKEPTYVEYKMFYEGYKTAFYEKDKILINAATNIVKLDSFLKQNPGYIGEEWEIAIEQLRVALEVK